MTTAAGRQEDLLKVAGRVGLEVVDLDHLEGRGVDRQEDHGARKVPVHPGNRAVGDPAETMPDVSRHIG